jgi:hypothetical protein
VKEFKMIMSEKEFKVRFRPSAKANGELFKYEEILETPINKLWSIMEAGEKGEHLTALPGLTYGMDNIGFVIAEVPWNVGDEVIEAYWKGPKENKTTYEKVLAGELNLPYPFCRYPDKCGKTGRCESDPCCAD